MTAEIGDGADFKNRADVSLPKEDPLEIEPQVPASPTALPQSSPSQVNRREGEFAISLRLVALVSFVFGLACLATLALVASVSGTDALATVALALAIVAFAVQLLASASQNQQFTQQSVRSEQLNTQTRSLLAEMQTTARGTETMVREQFGQLLRAFLDAAKAADKDASFDQNEFAQTLIRSIQEQAAFASPALRSADSSMLALRDRESRQEARRERLQRVAGPFPSREEATPIVDDLIALPTASRQRLSAYLLDKADGVRRVGSGSWFEGYPSSGPGSSPNDKPLQERGFLRLIRAPEAAGMAPDGLVYQLTEKGELAGRVLNGTGEVPDWAEPILARSANEPTASPVTPAD